MANIRKKNNRIQIVSNSRGRAVKRADINILSPSKREIVRSGLNTLNERNTLRLNETFLRAIVK